MLRQMQWQEQRQWYEDEDEDQVDDEEEEEEVQGERPQRVMSCHVCGSGRPVKKHWNSNNSDMS